MSPCQLYCRSKRTQPSNSLLRRLWHNFVQEANSKMNMHPLREVSSDSDPNLNKMGYNKRTKFYHRIKWNGGFYAAFCEPGTRITNFETVEQVNDRLPPCKRCFPHSEPLLIKWEWDGSWFLTNMISESRPVEGFWCVCRHKLGDTLVWFGPFTEATARELLEYLTTSVRGLT